MAIGDRNKLAETIKPREIKGNGKYVVLEWKGHLYYHNYEGHDFVRYVCRAQSTTKACEMQLVYWTKLKKYTLRGNDHSDDPLEESKIQAMIVEDQIKDQSRKRKWDLPDRIVAEKLAELDGKTIDSMHEKEYLNQMARHQQYKQRPKIKFESIADLKEKDFEDIRTSTGEQLLYKLGDYNVSTGMRFIAFIPKSNAELIALTTMLALDSTFDIKPKKFGRAGQVLTIGVKVEGKIVNGRRRRSKILTLGYVIMTNRTKKAYMDVLKALPDMPNLRDIMVDFEYSQYLALQAHFGTSVNIRGCEFHFSSCLGRKFVDFGWRKNNEIPADNEFQRILWAFTYLGFLKPEHVRNSALNLLDMLGRQKVNQEKFEAFKLYLFETWIGFEDPDTQELVPPRYSILMWNSYSALNSTGLTTNDDIERQHSVFSDLCTGRRNPGLNKLVGMILEDYDLNRLRLSDLSKKTKKVTRTNKELRLLEILEEYDNYESEYEYLMDINYVFRTIKD